MFMKTNAQRDLLIFVLIPLLTFPPSLPTTGWQGVGVFESKTESEVSIYSGGFQGTASAQAQTQLCPFQKLKESTLVS